MSTENELTCPVCRAKQGYQPECRRCGADLSLWIKALRSLHVARQKIERAERPDDPSRVQALHYLQWLSPQAAQSAKSAK